MSRRILVKQLASARDQFCGIGTRAVKLKLNRLLNSDPLARAFRIALDIEDFSTQGKKYFGDWKHVYFEKKHKAIHELIKVFRSEDWQFGKQPSDAHTKWIIYFHLPGCEQISFHTNLDFEIEVPDYPGEWDGKRNSTLAKLEAAIRNYLDAGPAEMQRFEIE